VGGGFPAAGRPPHDRARGGPQVSASSSGIFQHFAVRFRTERKLQEQVRGRFLAGRGTCRDPLYRRARRC